MLPTGEANTKSSPKPDRKALRTTCPVRTMVSMIEMLRSYESAQRAIQSADETERRANEMGRA